MLGTILNKPVSAEAFREAMAWCCNPANGARMMEYANRYEIAERLEEEPTLEPETWEEPVSDEEWKADIENALIELAGIIAGGE